ncbi:MAG TPA: hypothetical protein VNV43_08120 [Candidatus Acidoferrales bacterium]|nr:hypothetical protein [Candidatus Acidoferrales bacterium]
MAKVGQQFRCRTNHNDSMNTKNEGRSGVAASRERALTENDRDSRDQSGKSQSLLTSAATQTKVDALQAAVERMPQAELPLTHRFTPGMYIRTIFMPAGALVISKIHRTQHPFVVTKGRCLVWEGQVAPAQSNCVREIRAGHIGITMPGTRRILYIYEDTEWTTFHATDKTTPEAVEADIIEPHDFDREEALKGILDFRFAIRDLNRELRATADGRSIANLKSKIGN